MGAAEAAGIKLANARLALADAALELFKVPPGLERVARWEAFEDAARHYAALRGVDLIERTR